jgi:uncharacterized metal-binding protein
VRLDREGLAEMSCIAGVGGDVPALVKAARSGRAVVVLDGCPLYCAKHCLVRHHIPISAHVDLSLAGVKKRLHEDATSGEAARAWTSLVLPALRAV